jgi:chromosome segregation ATPase
MNEQDFHQKLGDLMGEISTLPKAEREKLEQLAQQTKARHTKLRKTVGELQESLDYLRLSIKYLVFDLEATRRENGYLRKMLEEQDTQINDFDNEDGPEFDADFGDDDEDQPGSV